MKKNKIFVDYDGCIINTIKCICSLYNEDFQYYKNFIPINWWEVNTWDFTALNVKWFHCRREPERKPVKTQWRK